MSHGLNVLVMGGATGVGRACAAAFAARGAMLTLGDVNQEPLQLAARELGATARFCDVTSEASVAVFAAELINGGAVPDILVNAAGEGYVRTLGMVWLSRELLPAMRAAGGSRLIINFAPGSDEQRASFHPYAATPLAFRSLSEALAVRTKGSTTRVMTVTAPRARSGEQPPRAWVGDAILVESDDPAEVVDLAERVMREAGSLGQRSAAAGR